MNKILLALFVTGSMLSTAPVWAAQGDQVIIAAAAQNMVTVAQAKQLPDKTAVTLSGVIVRKTQKDRFELKDSSGKIGIQVDANLSKSMRLTAGDKVKVIGAVDTHNGQSTDIEVIQIGKMENSADKWMWFHRI